MKSIKYLITILILFSFNQKVYATSYTWTGSKDQNWSDSQNWNPSSGIPGSNDTVTIVSATNNPQLTANVTVYKITMTSGTLDLNSDTLTINAVGTYNGGAINSGVLRQRGTAATYAGTTFGASVDAISGSNKLNGSTFNAVCIFEDTTNTNFTSSGGCIFNADVTIKKSGTGGGNRIHANTAANIFNANLTIINAGTREIQMSTTGDNKYNGNIVVSCTASGGIYFGVASGGTSTLASGKTISIGSGGFSSGTLLLRDFLQKGTARQTLRITGGVINFISSTFNAPYVFNAPSLLLKSSVFNDSATFIHTGSTLSSSDGGNIFNGVTLVIDSGSGNFRFGNNTSDNFNGNVNFKGVNHTIQVGYGSETFFSGDITRSQDVTFTDGRKLKTFTGAKAQTLYCADSLFRFWNLKINKSANSVVLATSIRVDSLMTFVKGIFISDTVNLFIIDTGATVSGASDSSFVSGPVKKRGAHAFVFPCGKGTNYRPLEMTTPGGSTDGFMAEYFDEEQIMGDTLDTTINYLSQCDYWNFSRTAGSSNVTVKLYFKSPQCGILDSANLRIAQWNGTVWNDKGAGTFTGNHKGGKLATVSALTSYNYLCLAYKNPVIVSVANVQPTVFSMTRDMQPDFNGYNGTNTIQQGQTWQELSFKKAQVSSLHPNTLRYPGGTVANYWNWREGRFLKNYEITS